ncbi:hypothetical protein [Thioalkalivibrio sulfidiphilus]|uniref:hypothetical protein n=1 Tax=Thioalkalivibrio sulfidiphilus TaxID=1033854 RepID=UPI003BAFD514
MDQNPETRPGNPFTGMLAAEQAAMEQQLAEMQLKLATLPADTPFMERVHLLLDMAEARLGLERHGEVWETVRPLLDELIEAEAWQEAVEACELLYQAEQAESIVALGHGVWLSVTYPVKAHTTVTMLGHVVEETPENADGAAVAAMAAHYIAGLRTEGKERDNLTFLANQIIAKVARRHRGIEDQETLETWIEMYELNNIDKLFPRLGMIVDAIVGGKWWFERDALRARLP